MISKSNYDRLLAIYNKYPEKFVCGAFIDLYNKTIHTDGLALAIKSSQDKNNDKFVVMSVSRKENNAE